LPKNKKYDLLRLDCYTKKTKDMNHTTVSIPRTPHVGEVYTISYIQARGMVRTIKVLVVRSNGAGALGVVEYDPRTHGVRRSVLSIFFYPANEISPGRWVIYPDNTVSSKKSMQSGRIIANVSWDEKYDYSPTQ